LTKIFSHLSKKKEIKVIDYDDTGFTSKRLAAIKTIIERKYLEQNIGYTCLINSRLFILIK
jgi:hypothetical protein